MLCTFFFFFQAEDGIRDKLVTGVQTCALPIFKSDGSIWFTDPGYDSGLALPPPNGSSVPRGFQPGLFVYRFFETNGNATVLQVITNMSRPNGICFSPDE